MEIKEQIKEALINNHYDSIVNMSLDDEEESKEADLLERGLKNYLLIEKTEIEKLKVENEKAKIDNDFKIKEMQQTLERDKFIQDDANKKRELDIKEKEMVLKEKLAQMEYEETKLKAEVEMKKNFFASMAGGFIGIMNGVFGFGKWFHNSRQIDKIYMMDRKLVYNDFGRPTPDMESCKKFRMDELKRNL